MKRSFADSLHCSVCGRREWDVVVESEDEREIREGKVRCPCGKEYAIHAGIVDYLDPRDEGLRREVEGWTELAGPQPDWVATQMTALPYYPHGIWLEIAPDFFQIFEHFNFKGKKVVDLGAGRSWSSRHIMSVGGAAELVAMDVLIQKYLGLETSDIFFFDDTTYFERVRADLHRMPLSSEWADVIFSCASLHHSSDLAAVYREVDRVLRPGGHLIFIAEPSKKASIETNQPQNAETAHGINEHIYSYSEWIRPLKERGYRIRRLTPRSIRYRLVYLNEDFQKNVPLLLRPLTRSERGHNVLERLLRSRWTGPLLYRVWTLPLTVIAQKRGMTRAQRGTAGKRGVISDLT